MPGKWTKRKNEKAILDKLQKPPEGEFSDFLKKLGEKPPAAAVMTKLLLAAAIARGRFSKRRQASGTHRRFFPTAAASRNNTLSKPPAAASLLSTTITTGCSTSSFSQAKAEPTGCITTKGTDSFRDVTKQLGLGIERLGARRVRGRLR